MATTIQSTSRAARRRAAGRSRDPRAAAALPMALVWGGAAAVVSLWWWNTETITGTGDWLAGAGRITGLLAGYASAIVIALMARVPLVERGVGSDRAARWHAMAGRYTMNLVLAHIVLIITGYATQSGTGVVDQAVSVVLDYPDMIKAAIGTLLLMVIAVVSARAARSRMRYEVWYYLHLLTYVAVFLAFWHQLSAGAEFVGNKAAGYAWYGLYVTVVALVLWYRILTPVRLNLRHRLRVAGTVQEAPGVVSVLITGQHLDRLGAAPGQFFRWRFLAPGMRWTANPYSLSAVPRPDMLRITVKAVGGHSAALAGLRRGTRVWAEGPYGSMTGARRTRSKVLLIAGGVGITPLRALFESLPAASGDLTLLYRAGRAEELALWEELKAIAAHRGARLMHALNGPDGSRPSITADRLRQVLPDIARHDVYLCGPPGLAEAWYATLREVGVPARCIHYESFEM